MGAEIEEIGLSSWPPSARVGGVAVMANTESAGFVVSSSFVDDAAFGELVGQHGHLLEDEAGRVDADVGVGVLGGGGHGERLERLSRAVHLGSCGPAPGGSSRATKSPWAMRSLSAASNR